VNLSDGKVGDFIFQVGRFLNFVLTKKEKVPAQVGHLSIFAKTPLILK